MRSAILAMLCLGGCYDGVELPDDLRSVPSTHVLRIDVGTKAKFRDLWLDASQPQYVGVGGAAGMEAVCAHEDTKAPEERHLAAYYHNDMKRGWLDKKTAAKWAQDIWKKLDAESDCTQPRWIVLNEISYSLWVNDRKYRAWVVELAK